MIKKLTIIFTFLFFTFSCIYHPGYVKKTKEKNKPASVKKTQKKAESKTKQTAAVSNRVKEKISDTKITTIKNDVPIRVRLDSKNSSRDFSVYCKDGFILKTDKISYPINKKSITISYVSKSMEFSFLQTGKFSSLENSISFIKKNKKGNLNIIYDSNHYYVIAEDSDNNKSELKKLNIPFFPKKINLKNKFIIKDKDNFTAFADDNVFYLYPGNEKGFVSYNNHAYRGSFKIFKYKGNIYLVNELGLEDYLKGVVAAEISVNKEEYYEAVKAQVLAARTYALHKILGKQKYLYDVVNDTYSQMYKGVFAEYPIVNRAIEETLHEVITYDGEPIDAVFHSSCGGRTARAADLWNSNTPYLQSEMCSCTRYENNRYKDWSVKVEKRKVRNVIGNRFFGGAKVYSIRINKRTSESRRVVSLKVGTSKGNKILKFDKFRLAVNSILPWSNSIYSNYITSISADSKYYHFKGKGNGHGVGMCQYGALYYSSEQGKDYRWIIAKYYQSTKIIKWDDLNLDIVKNK